MEDKNIEDALNKRQSILDEIQSLESKNNKLNLLRIGMIVTGGIVGFAYASKTGKSNLNKVGLSILCALTGNGIGFFTLNPKIKTNLGNIDALNKQLNVL